MRAWCRQGHTSAARQRGHPGSDAQPGRQAQRLQPQRGGHPLSQRQQAYHHPCSHATALSVLPGPWSLLTLWQHVYNHWCSGRPPWSRDTEGSPVIACTETLAVQAVLLRICKARFIARWMRV